MDRNRARRRRLVGAGLSVLTWVVVLLAVAPLLWLVSTSLKNRVQAFSMPPAWVFRPTLENYVEVFQRQEFLRFYGNSFFASGVSTLLALVIGVPAAYALARYRFRGRKNLAFWILSTRMAPPVGVILPFYLLWQRFGLLDTRLGLVLIYAVANIGLVVWMMRGFFQDLPRELEESALIDGCTPAGAFYRVALPLARNGIIATGVLAFILSWNEFLFALVLTRDAAKTAPVAITNFVTFDGINWGPLAAAGIVVVLPVFLLALLSQRYIARGLTLGAVK